MLVGIKALDFIWLSQDAESMLLEGSDQALDVYQDVRWSEG